MPQRERGRDHRPHGARGLRHALDQDRGHRRGRHTATRCLRLGRGRPHPDRGRVSGLSLHHRGSRRCRPSAQRGLRGSDALGRPHRIGAGPEQHLRPARAPGAFPGRAAGDRRRAGSALASHGGDGTGLRRDPSQHRRGQGGRSGGHGRSLLPRPQGRKTGAVRRADGAARHGRPSTPVLGKAFLE